MYDRCNCRTAFDVSMRGSIRFSTTHVICIAADLINKLVRRCSSSISLTTTKYSRKVLCLCLRDTVALSNRLAVAPLRNREVKRSSTSSPTNSLASPCSSFVPTTTTSIFSQARSILEDKKHHLQRTNCIHILLLHANVASASS